MSQLSVIITSPPANAEVSRTFGVHGNISVQRETGRSLISKSVSVQFGDGGPSTVATFGSDTGWQCVGEPSAAVRPGSTITVRVRATATLKFFVRIEGRNEPNFENLEATTSVVVRIRNPPPQLTIDPFPTFPTGVTAAQLPLAFTITGSTTDPDSNVSGVRCALDTGSLDLVESVPPGNWSQWRKTFNLSEGLHRFIVQAVDTGGNLTSKEQFLNVPLRDAPADPLTESITSWTRLEPQCRDAEMGNRSVSARVFDPLWLMARQWQMGEFQGVDAGTPVQSRVRATSALLSRCHLGELPPQNLQAPQYDPLRMPLEAMAERRRMRPADPSDPGMLTLGVEAGLHFLRMLELPPTLTRSYRAVLIAKFGLLPLPAALSDATDEATRGFLQTMAGRAPDARRLAEALRAAGGVDQLVLDPALQIAVADQPKVRQSALAWLAWYDGLFTEPGGPPDDAWIPSRMEYAVSVSADMSDQPEDEITLTAGEIDGGRLDWSSFDVNFESNIGSRGDHRFTTITETTIPAPVSFRGAPAVRFWELEDANVAYGLVPVGPTDLAHMMMIEYAGSYGNDWFVVPLTLPVGSLTRVDSLVVTDTFGVRSLLRPIGASGSPPAYWSMWQQAVFRRAGAAPSNGAPNLFFLPPVLGRVLDSAPLEDVVFMRDEMANVAWAIEKSIESPVEQAVPRAYGEAADAAPGAAGAPQRYLLSSTVPDHWIPLLPVQLQGNQGKVLSRLKPGAVLQPDGSKKVHPAESQALKAASPLLLYDEEVPREGVRVTRRRRMSRWIDGSTWVWTAFGKEVGRGEGSSGLGFDSIEPSGAPPDAMPPTSPGDPGFSNITATSATASWVAATDNVGVTGYDYRLNSGSWQSTGDLLSIDLTGLSAATNYDFQVRARDVWNNTSTASSGTFTTLLPLLALQATVSSTDWSWFQFGFGIPQISPNAVVTASGGSGGYTYAWQRVSGDTETTVISPSSNSTAWSRTRVPNNSYASVWRCLVTDSSGNTTHSPNVSVLFDNFTD